jgi:hypothetical protein
MPQQPTITYDVSFSVRGDTQAHHIMALWPTLTTRQSVIAKRSAPERRMTSFDGTGVHDPELLVSHLMLIGTALEGFSMGVAR